MSAPTLRVLDTHDARARAGQVLRADSTVLVDMISISESLSVEKNGAVVSSSPAATAGLVVDSENLDVLPQGQTSLAASLRPTGGREKAVVSMRGWVAAGGTVDVYVVGYTQKVTGGPLQRESLQKQTATALGVHGPEGFWAADLEFSLRGMTHYQVRLGSSTSPLRAATWTV